eukprot:TRINITY_DN3780_c0_g1_i2.p1 TRINITY_DN3780_c0_g1~~TRINITY_DN3780_c0_g1_i2.p1  ORF type:complete len:257 (+),score=31.96 TRINITY_DN3780_c0_g1_i2:465-1235(+)
MMKPNSQVIEYPPCPECKSPDTSYRLKLNRYRCEDCNNSWDAPKRVPNELQKLVTFTGECLPESAKKSWARVQQVSFDAKWNTSIALIIAASVSAGASCLSPISFTEAYLLKGVHLAMISSLCYVWGLSQSEVSYISTQTILRGLGLELTSAVTTALLKVFFPNVGIIGSVINATTATVITCAYGAIILGALTAIWKWQQKTGMKIEDMPSEIINGILKHHLTQENLKRAVSFFKQHGATPSALANFASLTPTASL